MKITLSTSYSWNSVQVIPEERAWAPEFILELPTRDVLEILRIQVEMEQLQQRLKPLYEAADKLQKANVEAAKEKAELERIEAEGENLPV